jgi:hypothetical protein
MHRFGKGTPTGSPRIALGTVGRVLAINSLDTVVFLSPCPTTSENSWRGLTTACNQVVTLWSIES